MDLGEREPICIAETSVDENGVFMQPSTRPPRYAPEYHSTCIEEFDTKDQLDLGSAYSFGTGGLEPQIVGPANNASKAFEDVSASLRRQDSAPQQDYGDPYQQTPNAAIYCKPPVRPQKAPSALTRGRIFGQTMQNSLPSNRRLTNLQPRVARLRDKILTTRVQVKEQRRICSQQRRTCHKLQRKLTERFYEALDTLEVSSHPEKTKELVQGLQRLCSEVDISMEQLDAENDETNAREDCLSDLEYRLGKKEENLYHHVESVLNANDFGYESIESISDGESSLSNDEYAIPEFQPPLLKELLSKMGDQKVYRDRRNNFEIQLQQDLDLRETLRGEGRELSTDEDFYNRRLLEQTQIRLDLSQARSDVRRLRQLCINDGIDIQGFVDEDEDEDDNVSVVDAHSEAFSAPVELDPSTKPFNAKWRSAPLSRSFKGVSPSIINGFLSTRERVRRWLLDAPPAEPVNYILPNEALPKDQSWVKLVPRIEAPYGCTPMPQDPESSRTLATGLSQSAPYIRTRSMEAYDQRPRGRACSST